MLALVIIEGIVLLLLLVLVAGLLRSHAEILRRLHELGAGESHDHSSTVAFRPRTHRATDPVPVAAITGATVRGTEATIALTGTRGLTLLAFLSSGCASCRTFWERFGAGVDLPADTRLVIVTKGTEAESVAAIDGLAPPQYTTVMSTDSWDAFRVPMTPHFVLVDGTDGRVIGEGSAGTWDSVTDLVLRSTGDAEHLRRSTTERLRDTDVELARADILPGDPSLYHKPTDGPA